MSCTSSIQVITSGRCRGRPFRLGLLFREDRSTHRFSGQEARDDGQVRGQPQELVSDDGDMHPCTDRAVGVQRVQKLISAVAATMTLLVARVCGKSCSYTCAQASAAVHAAAAQEASVFGRRAVERRAHHVVRPADSYPVADRHPSLSYTSSLTRTVGGDIINLVHDQGAAACVPAPRRFAATRDRATEVRGEALHKPPVGKDDQGAVRERQCGPLSLVQPQLSADDIDKWTDAVNSMLESANPVVKDVWSFLCEAAEMNPAKAKDESKKLVKSGEVLDAAVADNRNNDTKKTALRFLCKVIIFMGNGKEKHIKDGLEATEVVQHAAFVCLFCFIVCIADLNQSTHRLFRNAFCSSLTLYEWIKVFAMRLQIGFSSLHFDQQLPCCHGARLQSLV